jgi:hypothetical protein
LAGQDRRKAGGGEGDEEMRCILLILWMATGFLSPAGAQNKTDKTQDTEAAKKDVLKSERLFDQALLASDTQALAGLWAEDFLYAGTSGEILNKAERLAQLKSGAVKYDALERDDVRVAAYENTVVVTGRYTSTLLIRDSGSWGPGGISHLESPGRLSGIALFTHVYARLGGRWQIILEHVTYITED